MLNTRLVDSVGKSIRADTCCSNLSSRMVSFAPSKEKLGNAHDRQGPDLSSCCLLKTLLFSDFSSQSGLGYRAKNVRDDMVEAMHKRYKSDNTLSNHPKACLVRMAYPVYITQSAGDNMLQIAQNMMTQFTTLMQSRIVTLVPIKKRNSNNC